jgi:hypothetical protein
MLCAIKLNWKISGNQETQNGKPGNAACSILS